LIRPNSKPTRTRLKGRDYTRLRKAVYERAGGRCETCKRWVPLYVDGVFDERFCGHLSHKRHGSNKEDTMEGTMLECPECHGKRNSPMWGQPKGAKND